MCINSILKLKTKQQSEERVHAWGVKSVRDPWLTEFYSSYLDILGVFFSVTFEYKKGVLTLSSIFKLMYSILK